MYPGRFNLSNRSYDIFGHSAGAQFIQRMIMVMPQTRIDRAIAANAGTYTFPDPGVDYPYGLGRLEQEGASLQRSFATNLTLLLGELDNTADQGILDQSKKAMAQGEHRFARGSSLFEFAQELANAGGYPFNWERLTVPGVGHNYRAMSERAAQLLR